MKEKLSVPASEVGVFSEIAPLKKLVIWGKPGCETALGQLLPVKRSLFYESFDVMTGRSEYSRMSEMLTRRGVELIPIKDVFAETLARNELSDGLPDSLGELTKIMLQRANELHSRFGVGDLAKVKNWIPTLLREDLDQYQDEPKVIRLNYLLSLSPKDNIPMANLFYARDQSNVLGSKIVLSRMRYPIRRPEVDVYRMAYSHLGLGSLLVDSPQGTIEGGDTMILGDTCYIGVAVRTSKDAVAGIYHAIKDELKSNGIKNIVIVINDQLVEENERLIDEPGDTDMNSMHLDTFWAPLSENLVLACGDEVKDRRVELVTETDGKVDFKNLGSFASFMASKGIRVLDVTRQEQHDYATNLLHLGGKTLMVPLEKNTNVISLLRREGFEVLTPDIKELVGGFGAVHCMTASIKRG